MPPSRPEAARNADFGPAPLNVPAIVGFAAAAQLITSDTTPALTQIRALRDRLQDLSSTPTPA
ncbi:hypothetical protein ACFXJJ_36155, partial [Streptomyces sp. NPDC059233]